MAFNPYPKSRLLKPVFALATALASVSLPVLMSALTLILSTACSGGKKEPDPPKIINVTGISLSQTEMKLIVNEPKKLTATISPVDATNKTLTWESSNPNVATVSATSTSASTNTLTGISTSEIIVTAKATGQATINVKSNNGNIVETCTVNVRTPDIYMAGTFGLWKNGELLPGYDDITYKEGVLTSIFVTDNGDVHAVGYSSHSFQQGTNQGDALYYKNGLKTVLPRNPSSIFATAYSVFVSDSGDVYVGGREFYGSIAYPHLVNRYVAKLWKNGVEIEQTLNGIDDYLPAEVDSVFVLGNTVYTAGWLETSDYAISVIWKNGIPQKYNMEQSFAIRSVFVTPNGDVYAANNPYGLFKNGAEIAPNTYRNHYLRSVFVTEQGDLYTSGTANRGYFNTFAIHEPVYFKNGERFVLPRSTTVNAPYGNGYGSSIYVSKAGDVYVCGVENYVLGDPNDPYSRNYAVPRLWINGVAQNLNIPDRDRAIEGIGSDARCIVVK